MIQLYYNYLIKLIPRSEFVSYYNIFCLLISIFLYKDPNHTNLEKSMNLVYYLCNLSDNSSNLCDIIYNFTQQHLFFSYQIKELNHYFITYVFLYCCYDLLFSSWTRKLSQYLVYSTVRSKNIIWPWRIFW